MYRDDYLFFPEAQTVDKLLSVFNIQSEKNLAPDQVISILGLVNLLNIVSITQEAKGGSNGLSQLLNNSSGLDNIVNNNQQDNNNQQIQQLLQQLTNSQRKTSSNSSNLPLESILGMLSNNSSDSKLDPALILKLMNLINQLKSNKPKEESTNEPIKSEPYQTDEEEEEL